MSFTDNTAGGRIIKEHSAPVKVTLSEAVNVGDPITYNSGWVQADGSSVAEASGNILYAGQKGASADVITAYFSCVIGGITTGTAGNPVYLSDTQGTYGASAGTTTRILGKELGGSAMEVGTPMNSAITFTQTYASTAATASALTAATLTDSSGGTASATIGAITGGAASDSTAARDAFASVTAQVNAILVDLTNVKKVQAQVIDALQAIGAVK